VIRHAARGESVAVHRVDGFLHNAARIYRSWSQKGRLGSEHAAAACAHVHADLDREHDRLIQVNIHGTTRDIPHTLRVTATARAVDEWKRPVHPTKAHLFDLDRCLTGLH
jgi:hypothetical protein